MQLDAALSFNTASQFFVTTAASTNVIDQGVAQDLGIGDENGAVPKLLILVGQAFTSTNSATVQVAIQGSTDNSNWTVYAESAAIATGSLTANAKLFPISVPHRPAGISLPRYYRLNYTVATGAITTGSISYAGIVLGRDDTPSYPAGITVSN